MASKSFKTPGGTHDMFPATQELRAEEDWWVQDIAKWHWFEGVAREQCRLFGYEEIRTPAFENPDLFRRAVGEGTDIVNKEMYDVVTDRSRDRYTLRPEGTAPALRAYVQHHLSQERPVHKLYYLASIFRHEREQRGRYRQHHQFGVEVLGAQGPDVDAEVIALATEYLRTLGVTGATLKINSVGTVESRARYVEALREFAAPLVGEMSEDNQRRFRENPLRMLDSKHARDQELLADAPTLFDYLDDASREHFDKLRGYLADLGIAYEHDLRLVRGFDYYTRTAFEVESRDATPDGRPVALAGGGRYDRLVEDIGGPAGIPGIGFGSGIERVLLALKKLGAPAPDAAGVAAFLIPFGDVARRACVPLLARLRAAGVSADMDYTGRKKMGQLIEQADILNARYAVIIGDDELAAGTAQVRHQARIREINATETDRDRLKELVRAEQVAVPFDGLAAYLLNGPAA
jgi:histidyl-tRNA synthetase